MGHASLAKGPHSVENDLPSLFTVRFETRIAQFICIIICIIYTNSKWGEEDHYEKA